MAKDKIPPTTTQPWRRNTIILASVVMGGIAAYYNYGTTSPALKSSPAHSGSTVATPSSQHLYTPTDITPKHPSRHFGKSPEENKLNLASSSIALTENQVSYNVGVGPVIKFDRNIISSNDPFEDRYSENLYQIQDGQVLQVYGVYDGHSGHQCSSTLRGTLPRYVAQQVSKLKLPAKNLSAKDIDAVREAIRASFVSMDNDMLNVALDAKYGYSNDSVLPALNGAVVLVSTIIDRELFVANTGDVRAVSGVFDKAAGKYVALPLSVDHNADNPDEVKRIYAEHPPSEQNDLLYRKRVLGGLMPTRAFGDSSYKWTRQRLEALGQAMVQHGNGAATKNIRPIAKNKTPPYVTAEPEVHHYTIDEKVGFMIIASDGLWDDISSEQAVELVDEYIKNPTEENAATFLIRKALGQVPPNVSVSHPEEYTAMLLGIPPPYSRSYRDDITATVVFFHKAPQTSNALLQLKVDPHVSQAKWSDEVLSKQQTKSKL